MYYLSVIFHSYKLCVKHSSLKFEEMFKICSCSFSKIIITKHSFKQLSCSNTAHCTVKLVNKCTHKWFKRQFQNVKKQFITCPCSHLHIKTELSHGIECEPNEVRMALSKSHKFRLLSVISFSFFPWNNFQGCN